MEADHRIHHRRVEANGLRFHVAECGEGDRLALCLHGFPECWFAWRHQLPFLAGLGFRAWAPDLRGYGATERPSRVRDYAIERLLEDVAGLVDASGARRTLLVGHDWGAVIAWYFAIRRVRPLDGLVILNVPHPGMARVALRSPRQLLRSSYVFFFQIPWLPERLMGMRGGRLLERALRRSVPEGRSFPEDALEVYRENAIRPGALEAMLAYYRALFRGGGGRRQARLGLPEIDVPTLMIWGEEDVALGVELTRGTERFVRDLTLRLLPGVSHWSQQDAPETVNAMLGAWLAGEEVPMAPPAPAEPHRG